VWHFLKAEQRWQQYKRNSLGISPRKLNHAGKANSEGGSLWRLVQTPANREKLAEVIRWLGESDHKRAKFYRDCGHTLVQVRRHLDELHGLAKDEGAFVGEHHRKAELYGKPRRRKVEP
jgi:hypothetical protein